MSSKISSVNNVNKQSSGAEFKVKYQDTHLDFWQEYI